MTLLLNFLAIFSFILVFGYFLPAGRFYWRYHLRNFATKEQLRIQKRLPTRDGIRREIKLSVISIAVFALFVTGFYQLYKAGRTNIYWDLHAYPLLYIPFSVLACVVLHDTYFYWTHRLMHWRPLFKYTHAGHHRSVSPTPWAIYAFQPAEAAIQILGMCTIITLVPLHPIAMLIYLWLDTQVNTAGHTGFEVVPRFIARSRMFRPFNTVTHHDAHHTNMTKNFGAFFNVWDRMMGTFQDGFTPSDDPVHDPHCQEAERATEIAMPSAK